jgi:UDPglucose 6-dehydrogenase
MNIGFMGLGKLGLPCAMSLEQDGGHKVIGYDPGPGVAEILDTKKLPYREEGAQEKLDKTDIQLVSVAELVEKSDVILVPIQTPHDPEHEGTTRLLEERKDFDYTFLRSGITQIAYETRRQKKEVVVDVISTVLPGTFEKWVRPAASEYMKLCYNPFFIAMGTCICDFLNPEYILLGVDDPEAAETMKEVYSFIGAEVEEMSIESAELTKVAYNTYISSKICIANTLMEICHHIDGANIDDVTRALQHATRRVVSTAYMTGGMGDGGGCHPRDNIALSWLSRELGLKFDWFEAVMMAREKQTEFLADIVTKWVWETHLPVIIMGEAFKPETNLVIGSPSVLLRNILKEFGVESTTYDPQVYPDAEPPRKKAIYFIGTKHESFREFPFPAGSVVVDPHRYIPEREGVIVIGIGK